jgi:hypothetical protein
LKKKIKKKKKTQNKMPVVDIKEINFINLESFFLPPMTRAGWWIGKLKGYLNNNNNKCFNFTGVEC